MKTYSVEVWRPWNIEVEADSPADAIARVRAGEGTYADDDYCTDDEVRDDAGVTCLDDEDFAAWEAEQVTAGNLMPAPAISGDLVDSLRDVLAPPQRKGA